MSHQLEQFPWKLKAGDSSENIFQSKIFCLSILLNGQIFLLRIWKLACCCTMYFFPAKGFANVPCHLVNGQGRIERDLLSPAPHSRSTPPSLCSKMCSIQWWNSVVKSQASFRESTPPSQPGYWSALESPATRVSVQWLSWRTAITTLLGLGDRLWWMSPTGPQSLKGDAEETHFLPWWIKAVDITETWAGFSNGRLVNGFCALNACARVQGGRFASGFVYREWMFTCSHWPPANSSAPDCELRLLVTWVLLTKDAFDVVLKWSSSFQVGLVWTTTSFIWRLWWKNAHRWGIGRVSTWFPPLYTEGGPCPVLCMCPACLPSLSPHPNPKSARRVTPNSSQPGNPDTPLDLTSWASLDRQQFLEQLSQYTGCVAHKLDSQHSSQNADWSTCVGHQGSRLSLSTSLLHVDWRAKGCFTCAPHCIQG